MMAAKQVEAYIEEGNSPPSSLTVTINGRREEFRTVALALTFIHAAYSPPMPRIINKTPRTLHLPPRIILSSPELQEAYLRGRKIKAQREGKKFDAASFLPDLSFLVIGFSFSGETS
ncbi:MAG: hypothetical protein Q8O97_01050 [bacterium]|nr:hypothetical protein [bacterium]